MTFLFQDLHRSPHPLQTAFFISRPHRFAIEAQLATGQVITAHLADPGRLKDLLFPGARMLLDGPFDDPKRKTSYSAIMVHTGSVWVSLVTTFANRLFLPLLEGGYLPTLWSPPSPLPKIRKEVKHGHSRLDFLLSSSEREIFVETKSVTWAQGTHALFPDAPSKRASRHLETLMELLEEGYEAVVVFVVQRSDVQTMAPAAQIDPAFTRQLQIAQEKGVQFFALSVEITPKGILYQREVQLVLSDIG